MDKRYDQRSVRCEGCHFHWKAGIRNTKVGDIYFPEGCRCYGYSFSDYPPSEDCEGFMTEEQYEHYIQLKNLKSRRK